MLSILLVLSAPLIQDWTPPPPPATVPTLAMAQPRFSPFILPEELRVVTAIPELEALAEVLAGQLSDQIGRAVETAPSPARSGDVVLTLGYTAEAVGEGPEAMSIEVFEDHVALSGRTEAGVARAAARLLQLLSPLEGGGWVLPPFRLDDAPRFPWRAARLEGLPSESEGRRLLELLYLGSFNVLVLDAPRSEGREALARALGPGAAARGVELFLDPPPEGDARPLPYVLPSSATAAGGTLPVLISATNGGAEDAADLDSLLAAGRVLINGRSGSLQFSGDRLGAAGPQLLYGWSPLALLGAVTEERAAASASLILGAEVRLAGAAALPHFERALPYLSERFWGAAAAPATLEEFQPRAERLRELLGESSAVEEAAPGPGSAAGR